MPEDTAAPGYAFPFAIPDDVAAFSTALAAAGDGESPKLSTVATTDDTLRTLHTQVRDHAKTYAGLPPNEVTQETLDALTACRDLAVAVRHVLGARAEHAERQRAAFAAIDEDLPAAVTAMTASDGTGDSADVAVTAADGGLAARIGAALLKLVGDTEDEPRRTPGVRDVARRSGAPHLPAEAEQPRYAALVAAAPGAGYAAGQEVTFDDATKLLSRQVDLNPSLTTARMKGRPGDPKRPVTVWGGPGSEGRTFTMTTYNRVPGVEFRREFPENLRVLDDEKGYAVAEHAASERRLPGGNLVRSAQIAVQAGRALTAAAGWCAASETIYDLCELETLDGLLDVPEMQTTRGGWNIPVDGGPDFATIFNALGSAGDTHLTEAEVIADTAKVCTEIPCPSFEDVRLGVDYVCLTGGLLQRRGYPEVVARWSRGAMTALAHKINQATIAAIVTGSGAAVFIPPDPSGEDAASAVLSGVNLAAVDAKYRNRMGFNTSLEVVMPWWGIVPIRAALARRAGVAMLDVPDSMIMDWFTQRGAVPRFVYDWQDAFVGLPTGPGNAGGLQALPLTMQFLIYPAGTWVRAVQDVVRLDTIYDSTRLSTNEYTAVFAEDGHAMLQMCPLSRLYTVQVDPSGVTGCCPSTQGS